MICCGLPLAASRRRMLRVEAEAASLEAMQYYHTVRAAFGSRGWAIFADLGFNLGMYTEPQLPMTVSKGSGWLLKDDK